MSGAPTAQRAGGAAPERRFAGRTMLVFAVALGAAVLFGVLLVLVRRAAPGVLRVDTSLESGLHRYAVRHHGFTTAMKPSHISSLAP